MKSRLFVWALTAVLALPVSSGAQEANLVGTVTDTTGGVLPGVTVTATHTATGNTFFSVTDDRGVYRIPARIGAYSISAELPGFGTVTRSGITLLVGQSATVNLQMAPSSLEETVTVTGETPVVDVQSVRRETVLDAEVIQTVPGTRTVGNLLNATPGLTVDGNGVNPTPTMTFFSARGGQANEGRMTVNGLTVAAAFNGGGVSSYILDSVNADETTVTVSGGMGESDTGGPVMNIVPRAGGNSFRGQAFINNAGDWSRGDNLDDELRAAGITETPGILRAYDSSLTYSGPVMRDRLWFLGSYRRLNTQTAVEGVVANANAGDLSRWDWVGDDSLPARHTASRQMFIARASAQLTTKNRLTFSHEFQTRCEGAPLRRETTDGCHGRASNWIATGTGGGALSTSPEASTSYIDFPYYLTQALWTNPISSRVLLEAGYSRLSYDHAGGPGQLPPDGVFDIGVTEQSTAINPATGLRYAPRSNFTYRALSQYSANWSNPNHWRASASYVTGSHNMKVGYQGSWLVNNTRRVRNDSLLSYTFNQGNPTAFTMVIPEWRTADRTGVTAFFVQDTWTRGRMTLQGALRYDRAWSYSPGGDLNGTSVTSRVNLQPISFERTPSVDAFHDITPRFGFAYDVFGNGRTAVKFNLGHYLDAATNDSAYTRNNPANRIVSTVNRGWTDNNGNRAVDCDLLNFAAQGPTQAGANQTADTCNALTANNLNFGATSGNITRVNPDTLKGWGVRENDWQWGLTVQQELLPRMSIEVGYARRWFQGVTVTDNQNRTPDQYTSYVVTAPVDPRLPDGGGSEIRLYQASNAALAMPASNYITFQTDFGPEQTNYWHGLDVTLNARTRWGLVFSGGTSTGRSVTDDCETQVRIDSPDPRNCRDVDPFQTTFRGLASYTIPKIDVLVSGTVRSQPEVARTATWQLPNSPSSAACAPNPAQCTTVQGLNGFLPTGLNANGTTTVTLTDTEHRIFSGERRTQVDMRFAKILRFGQTRTDIGVDLGNLLNTNYATTWENTYQYSINNSALGGTWNQPESVYAPRFVRLNFTFNF
jgi:hypothetical protein